MAVVPGFLVIILPVFTSPPVGLLPSGTESTSVVLGSATVVSFSVFFAAFFCPSRTSFVALTGFPILNFSISPPSFFSWINSLNSFISLIVSGAFTVSLANPNLPRLDNLSPSLGI